MSGSEVQSGFPRMEDSDGLQELERAFLEAVELSTYAVSEERYSFAGQLVRMRIVGGEFAARTHRAFAHLRRTDSDGDGPGLVVDLWDDEDARARPPWADLDRGWIACGGMLSASRDARYVCFRYGESMTILDRRGQRMIGYRRGGAHLSGGEYSKPLLVMLSIWFHDRGIQLVHAGLVARDGAGILLPGVSGTGKSTTTLAAVAQGLEFLGDDFIGVRQTADGFVGHSVFNTACVVDGMLARFPAIRDRAVRSNSPEEEKPILFLSEIYPDRMRAEASMAAIALLRVGNGRTEVRPARPADALRALAASTLHTVVPRPGREALQLLGDLVARLPAYWLQLGSDLDDVAPAFAAIVTRANGADVR